MAMQDPPAPRGRPVVRILVDREHRLGLGWRLLSYLVLVVAATGGTAAVVAGSDLPVGRNLLAHLVAVALVVAITYWYRRRVDRRSWRELGLPLPGRPELSSAGAGFGLGTLTVIGFFGVVWALSWARVDGGEVAERGLAGALGLVAAGMVMYAASALFQELAFRGYFFQNLAERLPTRTAAVTAGLIFALLHLPGEGFSSPPLTLVVVVDLTLMACFLTLTRLVTGSLWLAIGFHTAWNWVMDYVFSLDTAAGPDYGNALIHIRVDGPDLLGVHGGVELLYALTSALLLAGYWRLTCRRRAADAAGHDPHAAPGNRWSR
jgi:membrane protease YdiL (CAAX protease family)